MPLLPLLLASALAASPAPVRGPSWLEHLGVELDGTRMGKMGGEGPLPVEHAEPAPSPGGAPFPLRGADLYRLECRACHGPRGRGAPPEIRPLLDAVRATSAAVLEDRQRARGGRLPPGMAGQLAADAEKALRDRITHGGTRMPAFPQLTPDELDALVSYLQELAGVAARGSPQLLAAPAQVGELLVKGTCHVCHPATGPRPGHMEMYMRGVIPSLESVAGDRSESAVIAKAREGRMSMGGMMGGGGMMGRGGMMHGGMMMGHMGRMPVFRYLTAEEVGAAYLYLTRYPPQP